MSALYFSNTSALYFSNAYTAPFLLRLLTFQYTQIMVLKTFAGIVNIEAFLAEKLAHIKMSFISEIDIIFYCELTLIIMRVFIIMCLVAAACAQSGYNYDKGNGNNGGGFGGGRGVLAGGFGGGKGSSGGSRGLAGGLFGSLGSDSYNQGSSSDEAPFFDVLHLDSDSDSPLGSSSSPVPTFGSRPSPGSRPFLGSSGGPVAASSFNAPVETAVENQFFTYTADESDFQDPQATNQFANSVKQGVRVVFIKGPENNALENAALALAKQTASQKTDIYVLNKQTDLAALANKLNAENNNSNNKPEVRFVKYRTPQDAANAQRAIQAEYNALGGKSQNINGGVASSLNFASRAPFAPASHGSFGGATKREYLPASIFRRFRF
ncbi:uncharacterized protein LOC106081806 [Stomoxys calcitrans]|uniref:uncharacterized protein LOC106081806 n=1 Tax=Stomoxys calcitrans TaxID=35570 RepID=UPI0027E3B016|nr:uncharacterized protein LOC106081806 [Stomoxys calcitrans]